MMGELKPCPFCGGRAEWKQGHYAGYVMCLSCEVMGPNIDKAEAIAAWNRRPDAPSAGEWMPIETAPKDTDVLLYCPCLGVANPERIELARAVMTHGRDTGWSFHSWATHWRPLPAPPQADGGEG